MSLRLLHIPGEPLAVLPSHHFHNVLLHANVRVTDANRHERIVDLRLERIANLCRSIISQLIAPRDIGGRASQPVKGVERVPIIGERRRFRGG
jgi:hypothetical protein